ncbi:MAG: fasciclin domain-containing protein [Chitinophagaceae bacterium]
MKKSVKKHVFACFTLAVCLSCNSAEKNPGNQSADAGSTSSDGKGQSAVVDNQSAKNVVQVAMASKDHSTLVAAVKAAELVDVLSNAGPFTVFAPTNAAFDKLPAGTVEGLLKPEKKNDLIDILQYHVSVGVFKEDMFQEGQQIGQVNGGNITISKKDGKIIINGVATIIATVPASNGIVYVIDAVLLPPATK